MIELAGFILANRAEWLTRLGEHVVLVALAIAFATAIGVPVGLLAARRPRLGRPLVGLANLAQTVPSLALFGFLIPLPLIGGIGTRTALVALTVYAVLPIIRTTVAGLQSVDRAALECAVAMGMTPWQVFRLIEWPLARPAVIAGIRVATVIGVGTATIASAIGAGGLGDYIFRGLAMVDPVVIMAGALPAAALALTADGLLALLARVLDPRRVRSRVVRLAPVAVASLLVLGLAVAATWSSSRGAALVVGSKNFTEQIVLGELVAQAIERQTGVTVARRLNLGGTLVCDAAIRRGDIDLYVEYTGTALAAVLDEPLGGGSREVYDRVRTRYADRGLSVLPGLGFNNTFAILVRGDDARKGGLNRISDLAAVAPHWKAGFGYEFLERSDGYRGLAGAYQLRFGDAPRVMDLSLIYRALASREIDVTAGDATAGLIDALGLVMLEDDRGYFPPYEAVPVVRADTLLRVDGLESALRGLAGRVTEREMRRMNHAVDGLRQDPAQVAREFLDGLFRAAGQ